MSLCHILPFCHLDDSEFALAMYDFHNGLVSFDHDWLANLLINLLISNLDRYLIRSDDLDPDSHVNFHSHCKYFIQDKLNDTLRNELRAALLCDRVRWKISGTWLRNHLYWYWYPWIAYSMARCVVYFFFTKDFSFSRKAKNTEPYPQWLKIQSFKQHAF